MNLSIFGGHGFVLGRYAELYGGTVEDRDSIDATYPDILYGISTIDNYNVYTNPFLDINTNLIHFMQVLSDHHLETVNFVSSWFVYGHQDFLPATEASYCDPKGFYSITKRTAEQLLISYCETFGLSFRIFRLANVLGVGDKKISAKKNALQFAVRQIVNNEPFEMYWPNNTVRDYIHVDDACNAMNLCITSDLMLNQIINVGNCIPIRFEDCINYVVNKTGNNPVTHRERSKLHKIVQTDQMWMENTRVRVAGYKPKYSIYQILDELIDYYQKEKNA